MRRLAALLFGAALVAGCGGSTANGSNGGSSTEGSGTLTVFAAASLQKTFTTLGQQFEQQHPGTKVTFSFAGSSDLATQITNGAPADVFASADQKNMTKVTDAKLAAGTPANFATNLLTIVVPPSNPAKITNFSDLAKPGAKVVLCAAQVPCGTASQKVEQLTGTTIKPVSEESSVTDVLTKVTSGEADAGLVYVTDAKGAGSAVQAIDFPESAKAVNTYPAVVLTASKQPQLARQFEDYITGPQGQQVLHDAGFGAP
ncbi:MAG TPA: molybdate ABC transporter substrate-binding protein [Frankiaceae bacterium]|nr:molybdate ABC transporter substrate-binding protein [Frankiaceae bacterium]